MRSYQQTVGQYVLTVYGRGVAVAIATHDGRDVAFLQEDDAADLMDELEHYQDDRLMEQLCREYDRYTARVAATN